MRHLVFARLSAAHREGPSPCPRSELSVGLQEIANAGEQGGLVRRGALATGSSLPILSAIKTRSSSSASRSGLEPGGGGSKKALENKGSSQREQRVGAPSMNYLLALFLGLGGLASLRQACEVLLLRTGLVHLRRASHSCGEHPSCIGVAQQGAIHGALWIAGRRTPPRLACAKDASRRALVPPGRRRRREVLCWASSIQQAIAARACTERRACRVHLPCRAGCAMARKRRA